MTSETDALATSEASTTQSRDPLATASTRSKLSHLLSYLVFRAHVLRFSIELLLCLSLFALIQNVIVFSSLSPQWHAVAAWAIACTIISVCDHFLLIPPYFMLRRSVAFAAQGKIGRALALLEGISPFSNNLIRLDTPQYFRLRCEFLIQCEHHGDAEQELAIGEKFGLDSKTVGILRAQLRRSQGDFLAAFAAIEQATNAVGAASAEFELEIALTQFEERKNLRNAAKSFQKIYKRNQGEGGTAQTEALARAYYQLCRLWTGYAEEAIVELSRELELLSGQFAGVEAVRPQLSRLYLERSYYFATHNQPELARIDLRIAHLLCGQPSNLRYATKIKEELDYRAKTR